MLQHVAGQRAVTHTQALAGAYACGLALWAAVTGDAELARAARRPRPTPPTPRSATRRRGRPGSATCTSRTAAVVAGGGAAWAAAMELALMLKEISRIPAEGVETREGSTSAMFGLDRGHLMVSLDPAGDPLGDEALRAVRRGRRDDAAAARRRRRSTRASPRSPRCPAAAALAAELALAAGHDVDKPTWTDAYYQTARSAT